MRVNKKPIKYETLMDDIRKKLGTTLNDRILAPSRYFTKEELVRIREVLRHDHRS